MIIEVNTLFALDVLSNRWILFFSLVIFICIIWLVFLVLLVIVNLNGGVHLLLVTIVIIRHRGALALTDYFFKFNRGLSLLVLVNITINKLKGCASFSWNETIKLNLSIVLASLHFLHTFLIRLLNLYQRVLNSLFQYLILRALLKLSNWLLRLTSRKTWVLLIYLLFRLRFWSSYLWILLFFVFMYRNFNVFEVLIPLNNGIVNFWTEWFHILNGLS